MAYYFLTCQEKTNVKALLHILCASFSDSSDKILSFSLSLSSKSIRKCCQNLYTYIIIRHQTTQHNLFTVWCKTMYISKVLVLRYLSYFEWIYMCNIWCIASNLHWPNPRDLAFAHFHSASNNNQPKIYCVQTKLK